MVVVVDVADGVALRRVEIQNKVNNSSPTIQIDTVAHEQGEGFVATTKFRADVGILKAYASVWNVSIPTKNRIPEIGDSIVHGP